MAIKLKYSDISNFTFAQAVQKIAGTPTNGRNACRIRRTVRELTAAREKITGEYESQIIAKFARKDAEGKVERPEGEPKGFTPDEANTDAFLAAQEAFGKNEAVLECFPFDMETIADIKMSATELEALKGLFDDTETSPGLPQNVKSLR